MLQYACVPWVIGQTMHKTGPLGFSSVGRVMVIQPVDLSRREVKTHSTNVNRVQGLGAKSRFLSADRRQRAESASSLLNPKKSIKSN